MSNDATELKTSAVTRSLDDLHMPTWIALQSITIGLRTMVMHPLSFAASRKRVSDDKSASLRGILRQAYRGDDVSRRNSIRNVYRGFGIAVVGNVIGETSCLWVVEAVKQRLLRMQGCDIHNAEEASTSLHAPAIAGMCGDLAAVILTTPLSIVCDRQITARYGLAKENPYGTSVTTFRRIWRGSTSTSTPIRTGLSNLYAGAPASIGMLPAAGLWWASYAEAKYRLYQTLGPVMERFQSHSTSGASHAHQGVRALVDTNWLFSATDNPIINGLSGVVASSITSATFTPLAVVRTRSQIVAPAPTASGKKQWRIVQVARQLYREEGIRGFYRGTTMNIGMAVLDGLAFSVLYEINKLGSDKGLR